MKWGGGGDQGHRVVAAAAQHHHALEPAFQRRGRLEKFARVAEAVVMSDAVHGRA
jgi:hypothetical protein